MKERSVFCRDIWGKKYKTRISELNFRVSVYGLIFKGSKILLSKQWDGYDFPGGGIEKGELIEDALKREVREETGMKIEPADLITAAEDFFVSIESKRRLHSILLYYLCLKPKSRITTKYFDKFEKQYLQPAEWVDIRQVNKLKFYNGVDSLKLIKQGYALYRNG